MGLLPTIGILLVVAIILYFLIKKKIENNVTNVEENFSEVLLCNFEGDLPFDLKKYKDSKRQIKLRFREYKRTHVGGHKTYRRKLDILIWVESCPDQSSGFWRKATYDIT